MSMGRIGLIAGGGALPVAIAQHLRDSGRPAFVARIEEFADPELEAFEGVSFSIGEVGLRYAALRAAGCDAVVFAGVVRRLDFARIRFDAEGAELATTKVLPAMRQGDDALLRVFVESAEAQGFRVMGADEACADLLAPLGPLGAVAPNADAVKDIAKAARVVAGLGAFDIGQGAVVCSGLVLAVEAQEGTDAMLARVAALPEAIRGAPDARRGVLVKRPKPQQERRIDLPTIGLETIERAGAAGLAGIAVEAGGALVMQRQDAIARADALGLFVVGIAPETP